MPDNILTNETPEAQYQSAVLDRFGDKSSDEYRAYASLGVKLTVLGIAPVAISDFLLHLRPLVGKSGNAEWSSAVVEMFEKIKANRKIGLKRTLDLVLQQRGVKDLEDLKIIGLLAERSVYPTPTIMETLRKTADEESRQQYLKKVEEKIDRIRASESLLSYDDESLEMYYSYLNIRIPFEEFKSIIEKFKGKLIPPPPSHFRPFRISAQGVEAVTHKVNAEVVKRLSDRFVAGSQTETVRQCVLSVAALPKHMMPKDMKEELITDLIFTVLGWLEKAGHLAKKTDDPFNDSNILGRTEAIIQLPPSYEKLASLQHAIRHLGKFIDEADTTLKTGNFVEKERQVFLKNRSRAEELVKCCKKAILVDLEGVLSSLPGSQEGLQHFDVMTGSFSELRKVKKDFSPEEQALYTRLTQTMAIAATAGLSFLPSELLSKLLSTTVYFLSAAGTCCPEVRKKLLECLENYTILREPAMSDEIQSGKAELILSNAHELYQEKIPAAYASIMNHEWKERQEEKNFVGIEMYEQMDGFGVQKATEVIKNMRNALEGAETYAGKISTNSAFIEGITKLKKTLCAKCDQTQEYFDNPPAYLGKEYHGRNIFYFGTSCKWHLKRNSSIAKLRAIPDLTEQEKKIIDSLEAKLKKIMHSSEAISDSVDALQGALLRSADGDFPATVENKLRTMLRDLNRRIGRFSAYTDWRAEDRSLKQQCQAERDATKERIYQEHLAETGGGYDPAVIRPKIMEAVKEIDKRFSRQFKEARGKFERENPEILPAIEVLEEFIEMAEGFCCALRPTDPLVKDKLLGISAELAKISYESLEPDEFELVPSKKLGDVFKGWVSDDCSKNDDYLGQFLNGNFVNYRVYKSENGEKVWVGNVYVLDARYGGYPVILFDAIQVSRSTSVNPGVFIQNVIEGFRRMAVENHYHLILSNEIQSAVEGWLVSNRTQLRQAYMEFAKDKPVLAVSAGGESKLEIADKTGLTFQSLCHGTGRYVVLWQHPDIECAIDLPGLLSWAEEHCSADMKNRLAARAQQDPFRFSVTFQSQAAFSRMESLAASGREDLAFYLNLMDRHFNEPAVHQVINDPQQRQLLKRFNAISPSLTTRVLSNLVIGYYGIEETYGAIADLAEANPKMVPFLSEALYERLVLNKDELLALYAIYEKFLPFGLGDAFMSAMSRTRKKDYAHYTRFADFIAQHEQSDANKALFKEMVRDPEFLYENIDEIASIHRMLLRFWKLNPTVEPASSLLNPGHLIAGIRRGQLKDSAVTDALAETLESVAEDDDEQKRDNNEIAHKMVTSGVLASGADVRGVFLLLNRMSGESSVISHSDILRLIKEHPADFSIINDAVRCLTPGAQAYAKQFVIQGKPRKLLTISQSPNDELDERHVLISHIKDEELEAGETLETLREKFMRAKFSQKSLSGMDAVRTRPIVSGKGYVLPVGEYADSLGAQFGPDNLRKSERSQKGELPRIKKANRERAKEGEEEEDIPRGYASAEDFLTDQQSVFNLEFHE